MADEILKIDENHKNVSGAVTDDSNQFIKMLRIDDTTKGLKVSVVGGGGSGTVTSISQGTGILLSTNPIVATGSVSLATSLQPIATLAGNSLKVLRVNVGETAVEYATPNAGTVTIVSVTTANGVSGSVATATSTPAITLTLGAITPTTVNGLTITANGTNTLNISAGKTVVHSAGTTFAGTDGKTLTISNSGTLAGGDAFVLAIAAGKTLTVSNSITLAGTDSTVMTFPTTSSTIARTDAAQTFTGAQTFTNQVNYTNNAIAAVANAATVPITSRLSTVTNSSAATLTITITTTSAVDGQPLIVRVLDFSGVAQTITWVNTENSTVSAPTTSNGSTTLPLTVGFMYNTATSKWRCVATA